MRDAITFANGGGMAWIDGQVVAAGKSMLGRPTDKELCRFMRLVRIKRCGCWEWLGAKDRDGYGRFKFRGRCIAAHRFARFIVEEIEGELDIDHTCFTRACVRPDHLQQATILDNRSKRFDMDECPI